MAADKEQKAKDELRLRLIDLAERKYQKNGVQFESMDQLAKAFIDHENKHRLLLTAN